MLAEGPISGGTHQVSWAGSDRAGHTLTAGAYYHAVGFRRSDLGQKPATEKAAA